VSEFETRVAAARSRLSEIAPAGVQRRVVPINGVEVREADNGFSVIGHAAVFDDLSDDLGGFREKIARGAFKKVLGDDIRFLVNHNPDLLLARSTNGSLRLKEDPTGLHIEADLAATSAGNDLRVLLERGDMDQMSFAFSMQGGSDTWDEDTDDGSLIRTINRFGGLFDVSAVTYPAYPTTDIAPSRTIAIPADVDPEDFQRALDEVRQTLSPPSEQQGRATVPEPDSEADGDARVTTPELANRQRRLRMREHQLA
jgi:HK97 family phage prohead protease